MFGPLGVAPVVSAANAARERLLATLAPPHLLRAELLAAEADLLALEPDRGAEAKALLERAGTRYRAALSQPLPQSLLTLH